MSPKVAYNYMETVADALLKDPNVLTNHREITFTFAEILIRKKFCELYGEATCKAGGFLLLKLQAGDSPDKHKIGISYPSVSDDPNSLIITQKNLSKLYPWKNGQILIRGLRLHLNIYDHGSDELDKSLSPDSYQLKLNGVELVKAHLAFQGGGKLFLENSYMDRSFVEPLENKDPGSLIFNTYFSKGYGKTMTGTPMAAASGDKKWGAKPYWEETFADAASWGYMKFSFNTVYKGSGLNGKHDGWLFEENALVNCGIQEGFLEAQYNAGTRNTRVHQNWSIDSCGGTVATFLNSENIEFVNNQIILYRHEGDGTHSCKGDSVYDNYVGAGGALNTGVGSKNMLVENNLFVKPSPFGTTAIGVRVGENINIINNTIASGNVAGNVEKTLKQSGVWQWDPVKNKYLFFASPSAAEYTIKPGMKLPGFTIGISVNKGNGDPFAPDNHISFMNNISVDSSTVEYVNNWLHPVNTTDYNESFTIPADSDLITFNKNYFKICGAVNHQPSNIVEVLFGKNSVDTFFLDLESIEKGTGLPFQLNTKEPDRCQLFEKDLQYHYSVSKPPEFIDTTNNNFRLANPPAELNNSNDSKFKFPGFNYWDQRYDVNPNDSDMLELISNAKEQYKNVAFSDLDKMSDAGYPAGNLNAGYPKYLSPIAECADGPIPKEGCKCAGVTQTAGFCCSGVLQYYACMSVCSEGAISASGCKCGNTPYYSGFCNGGVYSTTSEPATICGDHICSDQETITCPTDCDTSTNSSGDITSTTGYCGDGICNGAESMALCPSDCGGTTTTETTIGCNPKLYWFCLDQANCENNGAKWCGASATDGWCYAPGTVCPPTECDAVNYWNCKTESACTGAGLYWNTNISMCSSTPPPQCTAYELYNCYDAGSCSGAGGFWCNNTCQGISCPECTPWELWNCYEPAECYVVGGEWCESQYGGNGGCRDICPSSIW